MRRNWGRESSAVRIDGENKLSSFVENGTGGDDVVSRVRWESFTGTGHGLVNRFREQSMITEGISNGAMRRERDTRIFSDTMLDIRWEGRVGNEDSETRSDAITIKQVMEKGGKAEVREASEAEMRVQSFTYNPGPVGRVMAQTRGLEKERQESITRGWKNERVSGGSIHREKESEWGSSGLERQWDTKNERE
jgi:hypothetical protein